jgi:hypothetical protein
MAYKTVQAWTSDLSRHPHIIYQLYYYIHKYEIFLFGSIRISCDSQVYPHSDYSILWSLSTTAGTYPGSGGESWTGVCVHVSWFTDTSISMAIYACVMYRAGSLRAVGEETSKYKLDLVGVQVRWDGGGTERAGE